MAFGMIAEKISGLETNADEIKTTDELRMVLENKYPQLKQLKYTISVNRKIVQENTPLDSDSEVALLPPFSGG